MSNKKLAVLGIIAAFMVLWAVVQNRISNRPTVASKGKSYLVQGLEPADVNEIVLLSGAKKVTLIKLEDGSFVVAEKDNYPAEISKINEMLKSCMEIKTSQYVTDNPSNFDNLEVTEQKAAAVVKFQRSESSVLTGIIVGKARPTGEGSYVRLVTDNKVYIADSVPSISSDALNYIDQQLFSVKRANLESVTVIDPNGQYTLKAGATDANSAILEEVPAGRKAIGSVCDTVFTALTNLKFEDVAKSFGTLTFDRQYICNLKDTTIYTLKIAKKNNKTYITCTAVFGDTTKVMASSAPEPEEETKKKEAKLLAWEAANKFQLNHKGWIYEIPGYLADRLTKNISDLTEDSVHRSESRVQEAER
jgi:hypothetical protein